MTRGYQSAFTARIYLSLSVLAHVSVGLKTSMTGMSGDLNPPAYSAVNIDIDTIQGPVTIDRTVIGFIDNLESMFHEFEMNISVASTKIAEESLGMRLLTLL
jgi:hypothetical protein